MIWQCHEFYMLNGLFYEKVMYDCLEIKENKDWMLFLFDKEKVLFVGWEVNAILLNLALIGLEIF